MDLQFIERLVEAGASVHRVDSRGYNALHYAALGGCMETFQKLLDVRVPFAQYCVTVGARHALAKCHVAVSFGMHTSRTSTYSLRNVSEPE